MYLLRCLLIVFLNVYWLSVIIYKVYIQWASDFRIIPMPLKMMLLMWHLCRVAGQKVQKNWMGNRHLLSQLPQQQRYDIALSLLKKKSCKDIQQLMPIWNAKNPDSREILIRQDKGYSIIAFVWSWEFLYFLPQHKKTSIAETCANGITTESTKQKGQIGSPMCGAYMHHNFFSRPG